jgi:hypothetical protein
MNPIHAIKIRIWNSVFAQRGKQWIDQKVARERVVESSYLSKLRECNSELYKIKLVLQSEQYRTLSMSCSIYQIVIKSFVLWEGGT